MIAETTDQLALLDAYQAVRTLTDRLAEPLLAEDQVVQSMPDVSPTKWHRAHVSWFFEAFLLQPHVPSYRPLHPQYGYLFNSYYEQAGARHPRVERGLLSRPSVDEVSAYRRHVDEAMCGWLATGALEPAVQDLVVLGLNHEQQHQELLLMDIKHVFSINPLHPAYRLAALDTGGPPDPLRFIDDLPHGMVEIGADAGAGSGFAYDNETPRHETYVRPHALADRLVTNAEWLEFMADGGYARPELWLSDGWATVQANGWDAPLYWLPAGDRSTGDATAWQQFTLQGVQPLRADEPVVHVSFFEADAFARWASARLPSEVEWELAAAAGPFVGNTLDQGELHPRPAPPRRSDGTPGTGGARGVRQLCGDVWEWTSSPYLAYPGFQPAGGAVGEYNGKFMNGQYVLRGGCAVTPGGHARPTYRNFFPPHARWAFSGLRLAR